MIGDLIVQCVEAKEECRIVATYQGTEKQSSLGKRWHREQLYFEVNAPAELTMNVGDESSNESVDLLPLLSQEVRVLDVRVRAGKGWVRIAATFDPISNFKAGDLVEASGCYPLFSIGSTTMVLEAVSLDFVLVSYPHLGTTCRVKLPKSAVIPRSQEHFDDDGNHPPPSGPPTNKTLGIPVCHILSTS